MVSSRSFMNPPPAAGEAGVKGRRRRPPAGRLALDAGRPGGYGLCGRTNGRKPGRTPRHRQRPGPEPAPPPPVPVAVSVPVTVSLPVTVSVSVSVSVPVSVPVPAPVSPVRRGLVVFPAFG